MHKNYQGPSQIERQGPYLKEYERTVSEHTESYFDYAGAKIHNRSSTGYVKFNEWFLKEASFGELYVDELATRKMLINKISGLALAENFVEKWSDVEINSLEFKILSPFATSIKNNKKYSTQIDHSTIKKVAFSQTKKKVVSPITGFEVTRNSMDIKLTFLRSLSIKQAIEDLYDFATFISLGKRIYSSPFEIRLFTKIHGSVMYYVYDHSKMIEGPEVIESFEHFFNDVKFRYKQWNRFNTLLLWPSEKETLKEDFQMHYNIVTASFSSLIDVSNLQITPRPPLDPLTWFIQTFDLLELVLRSQFLMAEIDAGRMEGNITALIKAYVHGFQELNSKGKPKYPERLLISLPQETRELMRTMLPLFDSELEDAAYLRNRLHHTYLKRMPKKNVVSKLDNLIEMYDMARFIWCLAWGMLVIDILGVPVKSVHIVKRDFQ